jgi:AcrR family transcriptional regulator
MSRPARDLRLRRWQLYRRAAPVFARFGYRGASIKALAAACRVSPSALYYYFPSKRDFALFPYDTASDLSSIVLTRARRASADPLVQLRALIVHSLEHRDYLRIAFELSRELDRDESVRLRQAARFRQASRLTVQALQAVLPRTSAADLERLAMTMISITRASVLPGMERPSLDLYDDLAAELRRVMLDAGISGRRFDAAMRRPATAVSDRSARAARA